jgi:hypothetical protein
LIFQSYFRAAEVRFLSQLPFPKKLSTKAVTVTQIHRVRFGLSKQYRFHEFTVEDNLVQRQSRRVCVAATGSRFSHRKSGEECCSSIVFTRLADRRSCGTIYRPYHRTAGASC